MKKEEFSALVKQKTVILDGAMGTNLLLRGMPRGVCTEQWVMENPGIVLGLQREYVEAGSDILYAPTFGANRARLKEYHLEDKVAEMNKALLAVSKEASGGKAFVAGDMSPTGLILEEVGGDASEKDVFDVYREQAEALAAAGADLFVIETMMSADEIRIAAEAVMSVSSLPVICTMTVDENGRALFGGSVYEAAPVLEAAGVMAVGVNCCSGPDKLTEIIRRISGLVSIPVIAKPNAGMPVIDRSGTAHYDMDAETFVKHMHTLKDAGASVLGGCCGTTPEYIRKLKEAFG